MKLSDEYIKEVMMTKSIEHNAPIHLIAYQPEWASLFEQEKQRIQKTLKQKALFIEHIGSTSVPGLCAKPIIDILLVVKDSSQEQDYLPLLLKEGYSLKIREPKWHQHRMLKGPDIDINLHVFSIGDSEIERYILFRDYLRHHDQSRDLYAHTKRELSKKVWKYVQNYADAKSEVVEAIIQQAIDEKNKNLMEKVDL